MITPVIYTDRLKLRPFAREDAEEIFTCWQSDEDVSRYMLWVASDDIKDSEDFIDYELGKVNDDNWFRWAITDRESGVIYGTCLIFYNDETDCWDISYNLGKKYWGCGYITEAMKQALNFVINKREINEFSTAHAIENTTSGNVIKKLGFAYEKDIDYECGNGYRTIGKQYRLLVKRPDYSNIIGSRVAGIIDRPAGSVHPQHNNITYAENYGYVKDVMAADGEEQDVYYLGVDKPAESFEGTVTAVYHRINDIEDKWIVIPDGAVLSDDEILEDIDFQERYFVGKLYR